MSWAWYDWPLTWLTNHHRPLVLWHCWLDHPTHKIIPEMIYNVSSRTLNPTMPYRWFFCLFVPPFVACITKRMSRFWCKFAQRVLRPRRQTVNFGGREVKGQSHHAEINRSKNPFQRDISRIILTNCTYIQLLYFPDFKITILFNFKLIVYLFILFAVSWMRVLDAAVRLWSVPSTSLQTVRELKLRLLLSKF